MILVQSFTEYHSELPSDLDVKVMDFENWGFSVWMLWFKFVVLKTDISVIQSRILLVLRL